MLGAHDNAVLEFSGGKDSLACLYLLRPFWDRITVLWLNTGDAFPETLEQMQKISLLVPRFLAINSDQPAQHARNGPPSDILPVWASPLGRQCWPDVQHKVQSVMQCCSDNIWAPMDAAVRALGATLVIRGQRNTESIRSPIKSGHIEDGIEYLFPIADWSGERVVRYLTEQGVVLPEHYAFVDSSLDCQHCTAYLYENVGKFNYIEQRHPKLHAEVQAQLRAIYDAVLPELDNLTRVTRV